MGDIQLLTVSFETHIMYNCVGEVGGGGVGVLQLKQYI